MNFRTFPDKCAAIHTFVSKFLTEARCGLSEYVDLVLFIP